MGHKHNDDDYLFSGYNGYEPPEPPEEYPEDDISADDYYEQLEDMLRNFYGEYYTEGKFTADGMTVDDLIEYLDYNGYFCDTYPIGCDYDGWIDTVDDTGKEPPAHSIAKPVEILSQRGPKCSAYASASILKWRGQEAKPDKLYLKFLKLPDGSAIPSSVGKVIGAKLHTHGSISDIEKIIDSGKPVLVLGFYDKKAEWDNLHYFLVTGYDDKNIYIADSLHSIGERYYNRSVSRETFEQMWNTSRSLPVKLFYGKNIYYEFRGM